MSDVMENLTAMIEYAEATKRFADAGSLKLVATEIETLRVESAKWHDCAENQSGTIKFWSNACADKEKTIKELRAKVAELEAGSEQQDNAAKITRPECFDFAMDYLGDPEASLVRAYIEDLEAAVEQPAKVPEDLLSWKCEILDEISSDIYRRRYGSQAETAKILGITQPRVSAIANRRYEDFSLEAALTYKAMLAAQDDSK